MKIAPKDSYRLPAYSQKNLRTLSGLFILSWYARSGSLVHPHSKREDIACSYTLIPSVLSKAMLNTTLPQGSKRKGGEESSMFWWIVDLFLDRDWSDLLGLVALIVALVLIAVLIFQ
jgi:hypothetical protein